MLEHGSGVGEVGHSTQPGVGLGWEHGCFIHSITGRKGLRAYVQERRDVELESHRCPLLTVSIFSVQQGIKSSPENQNGKMVLEVLGERTKYEEVMGKWVILT